MKVPHLDRYEIIHTLGQGGMGVVYLARQKRLDRHVAIKSISPYLAQEPEVRERFAAEASVLARLAHPHIVTLYDYIEEPDALYLVMEYVEGKSLSDLLKAGPLPLESIRKYMAQVLEAFEYAHAKGVIHRDIKPSNVMITPEGQVKILDFGVAKILTADHSQTRTGMRLGTLMYMSPEQVKGEKVLDRRSDIYSLGVVLYEMLTGQPPYDMELGEFEMSLRIVKEPLFNLSRPPAGVPMGVLEVVLRATEKDPALRYDTCEALREDLERAFQRTVQGPPIPTEVISPGPSPKRRNLTVYLRWGLIVGVILLGGLSLSYWLIKGRLSLIAPQGVPEPISSSNDTALASVVSLDTIERLTDSLPASKPPKTTSDQPSSTPPKIASSPKSPSPKTQKQSLQSVPKAPPDTSKSPPHQAPPDIPNFQEVLQAEVQNFRRLGPIQVKAGLTLTNKSATAWKGIRLAIRLYDKDREVKRTYTVEVPDLTAYGRWEKELSYMVMGTHRIEAEVIAAEPF